MPIPFESNVEFNGQVDLNGVLLLNGDPGSVGQVPTSSGPGQPPTWETPSSGGVDSVIAGMIF